MACSRRGVRHRSARTPTQLLLPLIAVLIVGLGTFHATRAHAQPGQTFPDRAVQIIVPFANGSSADRLARHFAAKLAGVWKQDVSIDNRPGTARLLPAALTGRPANDGHVLLLVAAELFELRPEALASAPASIARALQPIMLIARAPLVLTVDRDRRIESIESLQAVARTRPRALVMRTGASGSLDRLVARQLAQRIAVTIDPRPRRELPGFLDAAVDLELSTLPALLDAISAGTVRALLVTSPQRVPILRAVPTAGERGLTEIAFEQWFGIAAAAGLTSDRLVRLHNDFALALAAQDVHDTLIDEGFTPVGSSPAEFASVLQREEVRLHALARSLVTR